MTTRAQQMEAFVVKLEKQVWAIWLPVVASAVISTRICLGFEAYSSIGKRILEPE
jgi:hypothetical protein